MAGACDHPAASRARGALAAQEHGPLASVIGKRRKVPLLIAALSNGISAHVEDFDDTCLPSILHPGAPVIPAALAAAEYRHADGKALVDAVLVGMEVAIRVSDGITPRALDRGWHITGLTGPIGAAAAAGRILGLDAAMMRSALGMAAGQGAGVQAALGTMTKSLHPGRAAANGLEAAFLSLNGFTGPADGIEADAGLARATADRLDESRVLQSLGTDWRVRGNLLKPCACGVVSHPSIAAATQLRTAAGGRPPASISQVSARVHPLVLEVMGLREPRTSLQAKFSVYHCIAVGLLDGIAGVRQFSVSRVRAPEVVALRGLVETTTDPSIALDEAIVRVQYADGSSIERHITPPADGAGMSDEELGVKVHALADDVLGTAAVAELLEIVSGLDQLSSVHHLAAVACGRRGLSERKRTGA
jgi:2-methylcitrate dehydratase PrpD